MNPFKQKTVRISSNLYMNSEATYRDVSIDELLEIAEGVQNKYDKLVKSTYRTRYKEYKLLKDGNKSLRAKLQIESDAVTLLNNRVEALVNLRKDICED